MASRQTQHDILASALESGETLEELKEIVVRNKIPIGVIYWAFTELALTNRWPDAGEVMTLIRVSLVATADSDTGDNELTIEDVERLTSTRELIHVDMAPRLLFPTWARRIANVWLFTHSIIRWSSWETLWGTAVTYTAARMLEVDLREYDVKYRESFGGSGVGWIESYTDLLAKNGKWVLDGVNWILQLNEGVAISSNSVFKRDLIRMRDILMAAVAMMLPYERIFEDMTVRCEQMAGREVDSNGSIGVVNGFDTHKMIYLMLASQEKIVGRFAFDPLEVELTVDTSLFDVDWLDPNDRDSYF